MLKRSLLVLLSLSSVYAQPSPQSVVEALVRESISESDVPAMGGVWVRNSGRTAYHHQTGVRRADRDMSPNVQPSDRFDLGSIGKVFTGLLVGKMVERGVLSYQTMLGQVFPELPNRVPSESVRTYMNVPVSLFMVHSSGMPYNPLSEPANQWIPADRSVALSEANLRERRLQFVDAAVADAPQFTPGQGYTYGGGTIVIGAMLERRTGKLFETLMRDEVLVPLGMSASRYGRTTEPGPWQHAFVAGRHVPDTRTADATYDFQSHSPAGTLGCSSGDLALFLSEWLVPEPRLISLATRQQLLDSQPTRASNHVLGGWIADQPLAPGGRRVHNGDNGTMFAAAEITPSQGTGFAAFVNANNTIGGAAVGDLLASLKALEGDYNEVFAAGRGYHPAAFPAPAVTHVGPFITLVFGRKPDGTVRMLSSRTTPGTWTESQPHGGIFTSGLAAASGDDGRTVYFAGRGTDNKMWLFRSDDGGASWPLAAPVGAGIFLSGPALAVTPDGNTVHVAGLGTDRRTWVASSADRGATWTSWTPVGAGVFSSAPAAVCTRDGAVHLAARGLDHRIYFCRNANWQGGWDLPWAVVSNEYATSSPSLTLHPDTRRLFLAFRDTGRTVAMLSSENAGAAWSLAGKADGLVTSAPTLARMGNDIGMFVFGEDCRLWSNTFGRGWEGYTRLAGTLFL